MRCLKIVVMAVLLVSPLLMGQELRRAPGIEIQLVSNPDGVDFRPYLHELISTMNANLPGNGGGSEEVVVETTILRDGRIQRMVFVSPSDPGAVTRVPGAAYLMKAEIAAGSVSAGGSLPRSAIEALTSARPLALPEEFDGDRIVVQFRFSGVHRR
jgi:hypothetical protein